MLGKADIYARFKCLSNRTGMGCGLLERALYSRGYGFFLISGQCPASPARAVNVGALILALGKGTLSWFDACFVTFFGSLSVVFSADIGLFCL